MVETDRDQLLGCIVFLFAAAVVTGAFFYSAPVGWCALAVAFLGGVDGLVVRTGSSGSGADTTLLQEPEPT